VITEPAVDKRQLIFWMVISLSVGVAILWLSLGLQPAGAEMMRASQISPVSGATGFAFLLVWAAYAYAISISSPHDVVELVYIWLGLILPVVVMLLLLRQGLSLLALLVAVAWLVVVVVCAWQFARRQPLAGIMLLPLIGSAITGLLFSLTILLLP